MSTGQLPQHDRYRERRVTASSIGREIWHQIVQAEQRVVQSLLRFDASEYQIPGQPDGQTPAGLVETICHQYITIVHRLQGDCAQSAEAAHAVDQPAGPDPGAQPASLPEHLQQAHLALQAQLHCLAADSLPDQVMQDCRDLGQALEQCHRVLQARWYAWPRWGRLRLRAFVASQFDALMDCVGGLDEKSLCQVPVAGIWTARELLAHVLGWEEYAWEILRQWPAPAPESLHRWQFEDRDAGNQAMVQQWATQSLIDVLGELYTYRRRTLRYIDGCAADTLTGSGDFGYRQSGTLAEFLLLMAEHRHEHALQVWEARAQGRLLQTGPG